jgi:ubiquitin-like protein Pup
MAGQEHAQSRRDDDEPAAGPDTPAQATPAAQARDAEVDALLEEIDDVLEINAEQFVRGFVQKGGQ